MLLCKSSSLSEQTCCCACASAWSSCADQVLPCSVSFSTWGHPITGPKLSCLTGKMKPECLQSCQRSVPADQHGVQGRTKEQAAVLHAHGGAAHHAPGRPFRLLAPWGRRGTPVHLHHPDHRQLPAPPMVSWKLRETEHASHTVLAEHAALARQVGCLASTGCCLPAVKHTVSDVGTCSAHQAWPDTSMHCALLGKSLQSLLCSCCASTSRVVLLEPCQGIGHSPDIPRDSGRLHDRMPVVLPDKASQHAWLHEELMDAKCELSACLCAQPLDSISALVVASIAAYCLTWHGALSHSLPVPGSSAAFLAVSPCRNGSSTQHGT